MIVEERVAVENPFFENVVPAADVVERNRDLVGVRAQVARPDQPPRSERGPWIAWWRYALSSAPVLDVLHRHATIGRRKAASSRDKCRDEMRRAAHGGVVRGNSHRRDARHADFAVRPRLFGDPLDRVVAVPDVIGERPVDPFALCPSRGNPATRARSRSPCSALHFLRGRRRLFRTAFS